MKFPKALPFAVLLLAFSAMAGYYATVAFAAVMEAFPASEESP